MSAAEVDVICYGETLVDFYADPRVDRLRHAERFVRHLGGAPTNVAVGLARLGARVRLFGAVGDDEFGAYLLEALAAAGVGCAIRVDKTRRTGLTFINLDPSGERRFLSVRFQSAIDGLPPEAVAEAHVGSTKLVHLGTATLALEPSRQTTLRFAEAAAQAGAIVSLDINWRPHLWPDPNEARPLIDRLLKVASIVKVADDELEPVFQTRDGDRAAAAIAARGPSVVLVTHGAAGCVCYRAGTRRAHPAPVVELVDATGAGDGFCAGFLASLARHLPQAPHASAELLRLADFVLDEACLAGNQVGSQVVTAVGATTAIK